MPKRAKPHVHARDHEHGGADVTRIHYEDVGDGGGSGGGDGIRFDTEPQEGNFLRVHTIGDGTDSGIEILDTGDGNIHSPGLKIKENGDGIIQIENAGDGATGGGATNIGIQILNAGGGLLRILQTGDGGLIIQNDGTAPLEIHSTGAGIELNSHGFPIAITTLGGGLTVDGVAVP